MLSKQKVYTEIVSELTQDNKKSIDVARMYNKVDVQTFVGSSKLLYEKILPSLAKFLADLKPMYASSSIKLPKLSSVNKLGIEIEKSRLNNKFFLFNTRSEYWIYRTYQYSIILN